MVDCSLENSLLKQGYRNVVGVDEVGRGCWAGPIVVGCYVFQENTEFIEGVDDSKKLSRKKREKVHLELVKGKYSLGWANSYEIDKIRIVKAIRLALKRSLKKLELDIKNTIMIIDGNINYDLGYDSYTVIDGDAKHFSIAAASILAKIYRDAWMRKLHIKYPVYGFETNVGYGTKMHRKALNKHGICKIHRKFYKPIQELLEQTSFI